MAISDYVVLLLYAAGLIGVGVWFATQVKSPRDLFAAGGRSPWWVSGLSGFMTMFSAGTFVVWGGIGYRYGLVAVTISLCYGVAAIVVGWTIAGRWRALGVDSAAEFLEMRFGRSIVQLYTWAQGLLLIFTLGGTIYALSAVVCELVLLPAGVEDTFFAFLRHDLDGTLSVPWTSAAVLAIVVLVTLAGGLWAVLITDVLQFIVLTVSVLFVVPLILNAAGGVGSFLDGARDVAVPVGEGEGTLLGPIAGDYTWWFLFGWVVVHYAKIGGEWAFVQRFCCVPTPRDAKKAALIFGVMYLVSPLFWMLPAVVYRVMQPIPEGLPADLLAKVPQSMLDALPTEVFASLAAGGWADADPAVVEPLRSAAVNNVAERAYINACREVLPAGMIGLMVAAMISATASMATTQLNVYAQAFTREVYNLFIDRRATDRRLVIAGRVMTLLLGGVTLAGALIIPSAGTYTGYIIAVTAALTIPLVLPTIWGLFSKRIGLRSAWATTLLGVGAVLFVKFGLQGDGAWLAGVPVLDGLRELVSRNTTVTDWVVGLTVPVLCLLIGELGARGDHPGAARVREHAAARSAAAEAEPVRGASPLPGLISGWAMIAISLVMAVLCALNAEERATLGAFSAVVGFLGGGVLLVSGRAARRAKALP